MTTRTYTVPGFQDQKYWIYEVDAYGNEIPEQETGKLGYVLKTIEAEVSKPEITDVVIAIHGWNTEQDGNNTLGIFERLFEGISKEVKARPYPANAQRKFAMIGVHWPSAINSNEADERIDDDASFEENARRMRLLAEKLGSKDPKASRRMKALLDDVMTITKSEGKIKVASLNRRLASMKRAMESPDDAGDSDDGDALGGGVIEPEDPSTLFRFVKLLTGTVLRPIENLVFGQYLKRAEVIGRAGVHTLLARLQQIAPAKARFHMLAHSLGGPALLGSLCGVDGDTNLLRKKVHSVTVLQGAMDKRCISRGESFDEVTVGLRPVAGPITFSTSQTDGALKFFHIAQTEPIGLYGAVNVEPLQLRTRTLQKVSVDYALCKGEVYNVIGDKFIDENEKFLGLDVSLVHGGSHGDIHGAELMHMVRQAFDTEVSIAEYLLDTPLSHQFFRKRLPEVELPDRPPPTNTTEVESSDGEGCIIS